MYFFGKNVPWSWFLKKNAFIFLRIGMREDYSEYIPERDPVIKETSQDLEDLHDDILDSLEQQEWPITNDEWSITNY